MLTLPKLEKSLRDRLRTGSVRVVNQPMSGACGMVNLDRKPTTIVIDPLQAGFMNVMVHELLHLCYRKELEQWGKLEECVVEAVEDQVVRYINRDAKRVEWWRRRILKLLAEGHEA